MHDDTRADSSEFYPGGRATATRRVVPAADPLTSPTQQGADAGDYYPGGGSARPRVIDKTADMRHSEFKDVAAVPARFNDTTLRDKLNEVIGKLKGPASAAIAIALVGLALAATADIVTVQTAPKGEIYNDEPVVTNVVVDVSAITNAAPSSKTIAVDTGAGATNLVVRPVYANVNLVVRECETANGQKQYRLIRKED